MRPWQNSAGGRGWHTRGRGGAAPAALEQRARHACRQRLQRRRLSAVVVADGPGVCVLCVCWFVCVACMRVADGAGGACVSKRGGGVVYVCCPTANCSASMSIARAGASSIDSRGGGDGAAHLQSLACCDDSMRIASAGACNIGRGGRLTCRALPAAASSAPPRRGRPAAPPAGGAATAAARASTGWAGGCHVISCDCRNHAELASMLWLVMHRGALRNSPPLLSCPIPGNLPPATHLRHRQPLAPVQHLAALDRARGRVLRRERGGEE